MKNKHIDVNEVKCVENFLDSNNISLDDLWNKLSSLNGEEPSIQYLIGEFSKLSLVQYEQNLSELDKLLELPIDELKAKIVEFKDDPLKVLYYYHLAFSKEAYDLLFSSFGNIFSNPFSFFNRLIDLLNNTYKIELFASTQTYKGCKGFIFELSNDKMGIVLTPLAFDSKKEFFSVLFHELSHQLFIKEAHHNPAISTKIDSEIMSYYYEKFLYNIFAKNISNDTWIDEIFRFNQQFRVRLSKIIKKKGKKY